MLALIGGKMKQSILIHLFWSNANETTFRNDEIAAHIGDNMEPPTKKEMQSILYAAKMEFARLRRKKKRA